ncbi:hypothetical protein BE08_26260 [Sorangium cellulosum]|uniref:DUF2281 domain-containing protein n=1 Tax=Sorangium cellulosum TaxID=56 RepID=A0A150PUM7_SORCE|nr:hypothetical protein BE08_26260 [Sorangium cellulosum]
MDIAHQIALRLGSLPAEKLQEVLDFVEFLRERTNADGSDDAQPFRGMPVSYVDPMEPVAAEDWEAGRVADG